MSPFGFRFYPCWFFCPSFLLCCVPADIRKCVSDPFCSLCTVCFLILSSFFTTLVCVCECLITVKANTYYRHAHLTILTTGKLSPNCFLFCVYTRPQHIHVSGVQCLYFSLPPFHIIYFTHVFGSVFVPTVFRKLLFVEITSGLTLLIVSSVSPSILHIMKIYLNQTKCVMLLCGTIQNQNIHINKSRAERTRAFRSARA